MPRFLTISPTHVSGKKKYAWNNFLSGRYISIGWLRDVDLTEKSIDEVISIIKSRKYSNEKSAIDSFKKFLSLEEGDYVAVNNANHGLFGVGIVTSSYRYQKYKHHTGADNREKFYSHLREVEWIYTNYVKREDIINPGETSWQPFGTVGTLLEEVPTYIKRLLGDETMTFLDAAYRVLKDNEANMHHKEITKQALNKGYIETKGKTPEATMTARINHEIKKKGEKSRFVRVERGIYGLSEWKKEPTEPKPEEPVVELDHEELVLHLLELGEINGYDTIPEYSCDHYRLDVVWLSKYSDVPKYCFEVHLSGTPAKDIAALKHANDKWNSKIFLVSKTEDIETSKDMIAGSFHEIERLIRILDAKEVLEYCQFKEKFREINGLFK